jgi:hypothetical protein
MFGGCHGIQLRRGSVWAGKRFEPDHAIETLVDGYVKRRNGQTRNMASLDQAIPSTII